MTLVIEKKRTSTPINGRRVGGFFTFTGRKTDIPHWTISRGKQHDISAPVSHETPSVAAQPKQSTDTAETALTETGEIVVLLSEIRSLVELVRPLCINGELSSLVTAPKKAKRKYAKRKTDRVVEEISLPQRKWITIKQAAAIYPKSEQAFRHLTRQAEQYQKYPKTGLPSNGFENCIVRQPGSRNIYLNTEELERWMARGQGGVQ